MEDLEDVTEGALPLAMSPDTQGGVDNDLYEPAVNVGKDSVNFNLRPALRHFCDTTSDIREKAQALELMTALDISQEMQNVDPKGRRRPQTAMARLQTPQLTLGDLQQLKQQPPQLLNAYETTNKYFFQPPQPSPTKAVRPMSSQMQRAIPAATETCRRPFSEIYMQTTYGREFHKKLEPKPRPERAASASGVRNNNPQPSQEFLNWRFRRPRTATVAIEAARTPTTPSVEEAILEPSRGPKGPELTDESYEEALRGKCATVYQVDFAEVLEEPPRRFSHIKVTKPRYDTASMSRSAFSRPPRVPEHLSVPLTRFHRQHDSKEGVIPPQGLSSHQFGVRARTTYQTEVNEPGNRVMRVRDLRELSRRHNAEALARLADQGTTGAERVALLKLCKEMEAKRLPGTIPTPLERRVLRERVGRHMKPPVPGPVHLSSWPGPVGC